MSTLSRIFNVFSRRPEASQKPTHQVPVSTRNRILLWCSEIFSPKHCITGDYRSTFWEQIHRFLQYRHGRPQLSRQGYPESPIEDVLDFLASCSGEEFLDFIEYIFRVACYFHVGLPEDKVVDELNELLRVDDLPYHVTHFIKEHVREPAQPYTTIRIVAFPKVIMRESEITHSQAIEPALTLLQRPEYRSANAEFLEALEDYRKKDYGDCLTKCNSAFESVLKVLCAENGWAYSEKDNRQCVGKDSTSGGEIG